MSPPVAKAAQVIKLGKITSATANLVRRIRMAEVLDLAGISQAPASKFIYQQYGKSPSVKSTLTRIANENRAPFTAQRSANANRIYEDMRAVANGESSRSIASSSSSSTIQMSSSKGSSGTSSMSRGSSSSSGSQGSSSSVNTRQGSSGGSSRPDTSFGRNLLTGELESKGKGVVRDSHVLKEVTPKAANGSSTTSSSSVGRASHPSKEVIPDYSTPEAPYSLRIDPHTSKGPMSVDSRDFTSATSYTMEGAKRNKNQFWQLWAERYPETLSAKNLATIQSRKAPFVDSLWVKNFPEHQNYLGEQLIHHHIEHSYLTTALPKTLHGSQPGNAMFHTNLGGKKKND